MQHRDSSRAPGQRRPRLLRASTTEPSTTTTAIVNLGALTHPRESGMSSRSSSTGSNGGRTGTYSRATDFLSHVAYLSSCVATPVSSISQKMSARSSAPTSSPSIGVCVNARVTRPNARTTRSDSGSSGSDCHRETDILGSSPASTNTCTSLEDLHHRYIHSVDYFSFPSFDTWDTDSQCKDDEDDDVKLA